MNRRAFLRTVSVAGITIGIAACTTTPTPSQLATDVNLIASGLSAAIAQISQIQGVPAATVAQLQGYLATIQADAAQVAAATATPAANVIQEVASAVQAVASVALPLIPGGSAIVTVINAAASLIPTILAAVGISGAVSGNSSAYSPSQARLILASAKGT